MTISRGQTPRQLYGLGSFIKKITRPVKKVVSKAKDFVKSDLGKAAVLGIGGMIPFGTTNMNLFQRIADNPFVSGILESKAAGKIGNVLRDVAIGTGVAGLTDYLTKPDIDPSQERIMGRTQEELNELEDQLRTNYKNLGYTEGEIDLLVEQNMREYRAMGGRIGFSDGLGSFPMKKDGFLISPDFDKMTPEQKRLYEGTIFIYNKIRDKYKPSNEVLEKLKIQQEIRKKQAEEMGLDPKISLMANGGRIGYAFGDSAEDNAIQASGIMGLPLNENPAGVTELDLRNTGGFIPPVGVKEKADDIPAMLSNNEFVFTADAVRGMGDGDVNKGAERMYSMMKQLENGGRV
jgi:dihydroxyacetone kinase DhaKLM complex PTS-EIIA-like component DhaM